MWHWQHPDMTERDTAFVTTVRDWIALDPDPATREELAGLMAAGDWHSLRERFNGRVAFGTAGLRATMHAGPTGMNRLVIRQSAAGIARHLVERTDAGTAGVVVAHDARHLSDVFARDCAEVIAAHGIPVTLCDRPLATPIGVFAVTHLGAAAGLVVTASHNPSTDNGLKLFMADGAQIVSPVDVEVAAAIDAVVADGIVVPDGPAAEVRPMHAEVVAAYRTAALRRVPPPAVPVRLAMTAMHGVGGTMLRGLLTDAGHDDVAVVGEQQDPDPDFPTVGFPNPEEAGATDLLAALMEMSDAAVGLALDPDADRVAVLIRDATGTRQLTGDQVGGLLGEWLLSDVVGGGTERLVATTVVSSARLGRIAARHGVRYEETLTGFKWLSRPALTHPELRQVLIYEEAIGYAIGDDVHDKDGITAALAVASLASALAARGRTVQDMLDDLDRLDGAHVTRNFSLRYRGTGWRARRDARVAELMATPPDRIGDDPVERVRALAPDVLRVDLAGGVRVLVRPSGTEPKLKCYCEAVEPVVDGDAAGARDRAARRLARIEPALRDLLA